jgi:hypothetical protein
MADATDEAGRSAVGLIALYRDAVERDADPTLAEVVAALGSPKYDPDDVIMALIAIAIVLLERADDPDKLLRQIALTYQDE